MKAINIRSIKWGSLIAALCFSGAASANWTFQNTTVTPIGAGATTFNSQDNAASTATVQLAAVYAANTNFSTNKWAAATLTNQAGSGQGVCSSNDGNNCQSPDLADRSSTPLNSNDVLSWDHPMPLTSDSMGSIAIFSRVPTS